MRKMLDGTDPVEALGTRTAEGLTVRPLYSESVTGHSSPGVGKTGPHSKLEVVLQYGDLASESIARTVTRDLSRGAEGLWLPTAALTDSAWTDAVAQAPAASLFFDLSDVMNTAPDDREYSVLDSLLEAIDGMALPKAGTSQGTRRLILELDPLSFFARTGRLTPKVAFGNLARTLSWNRRGASNRFWLTSSSTYHNAGAGPALELGTLLASIVDTLRALDATPDCAGLCETAVSSCVVRIPVSQEYFAEIAKIRAFGRLWDSVLDHAGLPSHRPLLHAVSSQRMIAVREPELNILRGTQAAFAALVGGADFYTPLDHDVRVQDPSEWGRRIARNTPLILRDESMVAETGDPAGGSYFLESLTTDLATAAWESFREIEAEGGLRRSLEEGRIQTRIEEAAKQRSAEIASGDRKVVGGNIYRAKDQPENRTRKMVDGDPASSSSPEQSDSGAGLACRRLETQFDTDACLEETK